MKSGDSREFFVLLGVWKLVKEFKVDGLQAYVLDCMAVRYDQTGNIPSVTDIVGSDW
jgi:hypothetical protein